MLGVCLAADGNRVACLPDGKKTNAVRLIPDHKVIIIISLYLYILYDYKQGSA